jgi:hypothetical protein
MARAENMAEIRFQSIEDGDLADRWYAPSGAAIRHPSHFKPSTDAVLDELFERCGDGLNAWLEQRLRAIRLSDFVRFALSIPRKTLRQTSRLPWPTTRDAGR